MAKDAVHLFENAMILTNILPQKGQKCSVLPVDLLDPLYGVRGEGRVDGDPGDGAATQVTDHVIDGLELLLQVVGVPAPSLGSLRGVVSDRFPAYTTERMIELNFEINSCQKKA